LEFSLKVQAKAIVNAKLMFCTIFINFLLTTNFEDKFIGAYLKLLK